MAYKLLRGTSELWGFLNLLRGAAQRPKLLAISVPFCASGMRVLTIAVTFEPEGIFVVFLPNFWVCRFAFAVVISFLAAAAFSKTRVFAGPPFLICVERAVYRVEERRNHSTHYPVSTFRLAGAFFAIRLFGFVVVVVIFCLRKREKSDHVRVLQSKIFEKVGRRNGVVGGGN